MYRTQPARQVVDFDPAPTKRTVVAEPKAKAVEKSEPIKARKIVMKFKKEEEPAPAPELKKPELKPAQPVEPAKVVAPVVAEVSKPEEVVKKGRPVKGSEEAKAWAQKMRDAKKIKVEPKL